MYEAMALFSAALFPGIPWERPGHPTSKYLRPCHNRDQQGSLGTPGSQPHLKMYKSYGCLTPCLVFFFHHDPSALYMFFPGEHRLGGVRMYIKMGVHPPQLYINWRRVINSDYRFPWFYTCFLSHKGICMNLFGRCSNVVAFHQKERQLTVIFCVSVLYGTLAYIIPTLMNMKRFVYEAMALFSAALFPGIPWERPGHPTSKYLRPCHNRDQQGSPGTPGSQPHLKMYKSYGCLTPCLVIFFHHDPSALYMFFSWGTPVRGGQNVYKNGGAPPSVIH